jgi:hypothetical protein
MGRARARHLVLSHLAGQIGRRTWRISRASSWSTASPCTRSSRKYDEVATNWPTACTGIRELIGELYAIERLVPAPFPSDGRPHARLNAATGCGEDTK